MADSRRVLIVDDDLSQRLLMRSSLEKDGMIVLEAPDGAAAVELYAAELPDLVFMDVCMPVMGGYEACEKIRTMPSGSDVAIVMVTGLDDLASIEDAFKVGATDFLTKPINWHLFSYRARYFLRANDAFRHLKRSKLELVEAQEIAQLGSWEWDARNDSLAISEQTARILGLSFLQESIPGKDFIDLIHPDDRGAFKLALSDAVEQCMEISLDCRVITPQGEQLHLHYRANRARDNQGEKGKISGIVQNVTEVKRNEQHIHQLAYFDALTGLPNRLQFKEYTTRVLAAATRNNICCALVYMDLDNFKNINDTLGHDSGDKLLVELSKRLLSNIRNSDLLAADCADSTDNISVARLGGDEFTFLLTDLNHPEDAAMVANRLLEEFQKPFQIENQEFYAGGSMGIAIFPSDGDDLNSLLKNADTAMYHAKRSNQPFMFYDASMNRRAMSILNMESNLRCALGNEELFLVYQPQYSVATGEVIGMEALLRWHSPELGDVPVLDFIALAEKNGMIVPIGEWVIKEAVRQSKSWQEAGLPKIRMAVNLSARQFQEADLAQWLYQLVMDSQLDPSYIELEITENTTMRDIQETIETLDTWNELGFRIAIDDFGTGYSSMSYLKKFPLDTLKIDRTFVNEILENDSDAAIVRAIITLGKSLGLEVLAEGVETLEQFDLLSREGCDTVQGFYFSKPLTASDARLLLQKETNASREMRSAAGATPTSR